MPQRSDRPDPADDAGPAGPGASTAEGSADGEGDADEVSAGDGSAAEGDAAEGDADEGADEGDGAAPGRADSEPAPGREPRRRRRSVDALLLSVELAALAAFAFSRPVLDIFGRSPETLIARGVTGRWVVVFGLVVTVVPAAVAAAVGLVARGLSGRFAMRVHAGIVGILAGVGAWRMGQDVTGWPGEATKLLLLGGLVALLIAGLRDRVPSTASFLRIGGAASVVYLVIFVFASPASNLVFPPAGASGDDLAAIDGQIGDDAPDVVVLVFDELPLATLLDGSGHIDGELFPNFAALAGDGTWYRNNTTVSGFTQQAIPALLTGRYPEGGRPDPQNAASQSLFTLLDGSYDVRAVEEITSVCPPSICPETDRVDLGGLLDDAVDVWGWDPSEIDAVEALARSAGPIDPAGLHLDRRRAGDRPRLVFDHVMFPHVPWRETADGTPYVGSMPGAGVVGVGWSSWGARVGQQRHVLQTQAADRLLGEYIAALRDAEAYDDSLVVVTADHGISFESTKPLRGLSRKTYPQIMWTPLIVKTPGQAAGRIDDRDTRSIDLVPTVADVIGVDIPWEVDGVPVDEAAERDDESKPFVPTTSDKWRAEDGPILEVDARPGFEQVLAADAVEWTGPDAVWRRTEHGGLFGRDLEELTVGRPVDAQLAVDDLEGFTTRVRGFPPRIEIIGEVVGDDLPRVGTPVAFAVGGTIGAVTEIEDIRRFDRSIGERAHAIVPPDLLDVGTNELEAFVVEGPVGDEVLHPVEVVGT